MTLLYSRWSEGVEERCSECLAVPFFEKRELMKFMNFFSLEAINETEGGWIGWTLELSSIQDSDKDRSL